MKCDLKRMENCMEGRMEYLGQLIKIAWAYVRLSLFLSLFPLLEIKHLFLILSLSKTYCRPRIAPRSQT